MTEMSQTARPEQGSTVPRGLPPLRSLSGARLQVVLEVLDEYEPTLKRLSEI